MSDRRIWKRQDLAYYKIFTSDRYFVAEPGRLPATAIKTFEYTISRTISWYIIHLLIVQAQSRCCWLEFFCLLTWRAALSLLITASMRGSYTLYEVSLCACVFFFYFHVWLLASKPNTIRCYISYLCVFLVALVKIANHGTTWSSCLNGRFYHILLSLLKSGSNYASECLLYVARKMSKRELHHLSMMTCLGNQCETKDSGPVFSIWQKRVFVYLNMIDCLYVISRLCMQLYMFVYSLYSTCFSCY